jgi:hypothetical protein
MADRPPTKRLISLADFFPQADIPSASQIDVN